VIYTIRLSNRAIKELDRLDTRTRERIRERLRELADDPFSVRLSEPLTNKGDLRKSRVGGWRIIFRVHDDVLEVSVVTIARRGQVYKRF